MQKLGFRQTITIGFMLFSMFFGAGNLIFPPLLGAQAGSSTVLAMVGLTITAVCFPILAVAAVAKHDNLVKLGSMIHPVFASVFTIGPFLTQLQALRTISAFTVNLSYNLEPLYSIVLAMMLFDEGQELNGAFWFGVLLIILSVVLQTALSRRAEATICGK